MKTQYKILAPASPGASYKIVSVSQNGQRDEGTFSVEDGRVWLDLDRVMLPPETWKEMREIIDRTLGRR